MNVLNTNPFIKILGFEILGILLSNYLPESVWVFSFLLIFLLIWVVKLGIAKKYPYDLAYSFLLATIIILLIFPNVRLYNRNDDISHSGQCVFTAQILEKAQEKTNSFQTLIHVNKADSTWLQGQKIIAYFEKSGEIKDLNPGDLIVTKAYVNEINNRGNPYEFDYRSYLAKQKIYFSTYIKAANFSKNESSEMSLFIRAERFRQQLLSQLEASLNNHQAFQVVSALTLGYRNELTQETRSYFTSTGAMHVLAVSGLHVGVIFMCINWMFSFLKRSKVGRVINFFAILTALWCYAMITGFSPSVQRATVMFTFVLVGNSLNRLTSIYNSITASAFFLLLLNPNLIFDVGFQLSYMAVVSIVFFYPRLEKLMSVKNFLLKNIWQLFCVSFAAQIGTFALSVYYFNQFPLYFWLSNFVVIPSVFIILGLTLLFFILSPILAVKQGIAWILSGFTDIELLILKQIGQLPFALIEGLSISTTQLFCLVFMLGIWGLFVKYKQKYFFFASLICIVAFLGTGLVHKYILFNQCRVIEYQSDKPITHLINGRRNYLITSSESGLNTYLYENVVFELELLPPVIINVDEKIDVNNSDLLISGEFVQFADKRFHVLNNGKLSFLQ